MDIVTKKNIEDIYELTSKEKIALLKKQLLEKAKRENSFFPLSYGQKALYFLYLTSPESAAYNVAFTARIISECDIDALHRSFQNLINRHTSLRTTYNIRDGKPIQEVHGYQEIFFEVTDVAVLNEDELKEKVKAVYLIPFDLENGPVFKVHLFKISKDNIILLFKFHHIASDGWSFGIILNELELFYLSEAEGKKISLPHSKINFSDYINMQGEMLKGPKGKELLEYWKNELSDSSTILNLPFDRQRVNTNTNEGSSVFFESGKELLNKLRTLTKSEGVTLFTILISSFLLLLYKYSNQKDILLGTTTAGRNFSGTEYLVGYFVSPVAIRGRFNEDMSFKTFLNHVKKTVLGALEHQDYPFPLLVEKLMPVREQNITPIFQVEFGLNKIPQNTPVQNIIVAGNDGLQVDWAGLKLEHYPLKQQEGQFDMFFEIAESENNISGYLKYNTDLFDEQTIVRMTNRYKILLNNITENVQTNISDLKIFEETKLPSISRIQRNN
jgi:hypothetical protein